jgi:hypothetical protein
VAAIRRPRLARTRLLVPLVAALVVLIALLGGGTRLYTDLLFFRSVGFSEVFTTVLYTRVLLFVLFGAVMAVAVGTNIVLAYRLRPPVRPLSAEQHNLERYRVAVEPYMLWILLGVCAFFGGVSGLSASTRWQTWLSWRNSESFGKTDPQFGRDISYYVFTYPFERFLLGFLLTAVVLSLLVTLVTHYLFGGIRIQSPGSGDAGRKGAHLRPARAAGPSQGVGVLPGPVRPGVLGAGFHDGCLVHGCACGAPSEAHPVVHLAAVRGPVHLQHLPAGLDAADPVRRHPRPVRAGGRRHLSGDRPAVPGAPERGVPRGALHRAQHHLDPGGVRHRRREADVVRRAQRADARRVGSDTGTIPYARLLDPNIVSPSFQQLQQIRGYYGFTETLDIDRYALPDGEGKSTTQDYVVAVRELDQDNLAESQRNWINLHLTYTHGNGFVAAPANRVDGSGRPEFIEGDLPPRNTIQIRESRIYFGEMSPEYSVVGTRQEEIDGPGDTPDSQATSRYKGGGGVSVGSVFRRLLFAARFQEKNILLSSDITGQSRILYLRTPRERVSKVAPWLTLDGDAYPTVVKGRIVWVVDGYTTTNGYPYSARRSLEAATSDAVSTQSESRAEQAANKINYIRNSVKATVDAYDGTVTLYAWDEEDPVLRTWMKAFPGTVEPKSAIPAALLSHFRYPEDFFKVQTRHPRPLPRHQARRVLLAGGLLGGVGLAGQPPGAPAAVLRLQPASRGENTDLQPHLADDLAALVEARILRGGFVRPGQLRTVHRPAAPAGYDHQRPGSGPGCDRVGRRRVGTAQPVEGLRFQGREGESADASRCGRSCSTSSRTM